MAWWWKSRPCRKPHFFQSMSKCPYHDPFAEKRKEGPVLETEFDGDPVAMILGLRRTSRPPATGRPSVRCPLSGSHSAGGGLEKRPAIPDRIRSARAHRVPQDRGTCLQSPERTGIPSANDRFDSRNDLRNDFQRIGRSGFRIRSPSAIPGLDLLARGSRI